MFCVVVVVNRSHVKCYFIVTMLLHVYINDLWYLLSQLSAMQCLCIADCGVPPRLPNGKYTHGNTTFGSIARVRCDLGYLEDQADIICTENATWTTTQCIVRSKIITLLKPNYVIITFN